ncbi:TaqI-like C-terminal specificity domain-containing protein [Thermodesulfovibrio sp. 3907-1M]|uniref:site-specific DNA-methyltransferase (adenine-specific) n=1 Tax=Thermodesulfovibrio autotrophicus TaxID=3118333 RepID=A0AAU8GVG2_9BACT
MNREQAKKIIVETFENPFNKSNFVNFVTNLLKSYNRTKALEPRSGIQGVTERYLNFISSWERVGRYEDKIGNKIDILVVNLKRGTSLYRARTAQRNFVAEYLRGRLGTTTEKDAALVAFVSPDEEDWRFSLVKMDYRFEETPVGKVKVKEEFTPAKRWSFLVGKNEKSHTAQSRFLPILENDELKPTLEDLEKAFDIEVVTKEFFEKYRDLFIRTKLELDKIVKNSQIVQREFQNKNINTVDFAKKLLGQIVFLYFLQKKGWFGVERGKLWGTGPKDFIRRLFNREFGDYKNFYNDILEPLFYEALRTDRTAYDHYYNRFNCKIPFLNGGLFDPINDFDWENVDLLLPNELFSNSNRTKEGDIGDGILDVFDRYNFTVNEEEPLEKEVALDPELLGKIYEKLNAIRPDNFDEYVKVLKSGKKGEETKFNKEYGVYYTPREIVHYMCQESLISYLCSTDILVCTKKDIEEFVKYADLILEHERTAIEKKEKIEMGYQKETKYEHKMPESIIQNAELIDKLLADIKVCDPAVGSGAFPIGMMHEIVKLRQLLSIYLNREINTYQLKRHSIENSLYGVDIDPGAVEICKLRFWLSMIVDEEDFYQIKPLPNLDYKVVCGDSLLGVEKDLFNADAFGRLEKLKPLYFNETNPSKKQEYKRQIDELIREITKGHTEFDFEVYFSEVFHQKGGFDIVIANPPYSGVLRSKDKLVNQYRYFDSRKNSASFFIERATHITNIKGIVAYIVPKSLTYVEGWENTRKFVLNKNLLIDIADVSKAFEDVLLEQVIIIFKSDTQQKNYEFFTFEGWSKNILRLGKISIADCHNLNIIPVYLDDQKKNILYKMRENSLPLSSISKTFRGLPFQKRVVGKGGIEILKGKNIGKYRIYGKIDYVKLDKTELINKKIQELMRPKIISQNIVAHVMNPFDRIIIMATYDKEGFLTLDTVMNTFLTDDRFSYEYILGILNSRLAEWFYYWFVYNRAIRTMHFDEYYIGKLPMKKITPQNQPIVKGIENLVSQILSLTQSEDYMENQQKQTQVKALEREIDQLVYKLYALTEEEIKIIEGNKI